mgnify:CR=1 FL=1
MSGGISGQVRSRRRSLPKVLQGISRRCSHQCLDNYSVGRTHSPPVIFKERGENMAENQGTSVGKISLDLVIANKLGEQLGKIKAMAESPAKQIGESIEQAIEEPFERTAKNISDTFDSAFSGMSEAAENAGKSIDNGINEAMERLFERERAARESLENLRNSAPSSINIETSLNYDTSEMTSRVNETVNAVREEMTEVSENIHEQLEQAFDVSANPTERLRQEIENTYEKLDLLQKKWQELSSAEPTDRVISQLNATEHQIISTQSAIQRMETQFSQLSESSGNNLNILTEKFSEKLKKVFESSKSFFSSLKKIGSKAFKTLKSVGGKALDSLKSRFGFLNKSAVSLAKPVEKLGRTLKNTFRRVFVTATLFAAVRALKSSLSDILKTNSELSDSLNEVKANLSIAFTPIIQAAMPALNTLMSGLAAVTKQIAAFTSGLFGMTYKQAAQATQKLKKIY